MNQLPNAHGRARTLGPREAELIAWLEVERPATITPAAVSGEFGWSISSVYNLLSRLARKGWLQRTVAGTYAPLLGETGGIALPDPWAALASWSAPYYVALASAAYERGLTPDRPGDVQVCVRVGTIRPRNWKEVPIALIPRHGFNLEGSSVESLHGFPVRLATTERIVLDAAMLPGQVGGVLGLARIVDRAAEQMDWETFVKLAHPEARGRAAARRVAALLEILGRVVPAGLADVAAASPKDAVLYLGSIGPYGRRGQIISRWRVLNNVGDEAITEEIRR